VLKESPSKLGNYEILIGCGSRIIMNILYEMKKSLNKIYEYIRNNPDVERYNWDELD